MIKQTPQEWNDYGVYGLPSLREALFEGCVGELPKSWDHAAVFLARKKTIFQLKSDAFFYGVPRYVGHVRNDFAYRRVRDAFCVNYEFYCKKIRQGEQLVCEANIRPYFPVRVDNETLPKVDIQQHKSRSKSVGSRALKHALEMLGE